MYGVTGATGQLGRKIVDSLAKRTSTDDIVALVRDPARAATLGVSVRPGDYNRQDQLTAALQGIDTLLVVSSNSMETRQQEHANVIAAAKTAGVKRLIYTSLLHAERWKHWFAKDHLQTEAMLKASGLDFTILRNGWYFENHTVSIPPSLAHGAMIGSAGSGLVSWAARQDFADAAAAVMTSAGHEGRTYELAGDTAYRLDALAAEVSRRSGRPFTYRDLTEAQHAAALEQVGLPALFAAMIAAVEAQDVSTGVLQEEGGALRALIGRPTTSLAEAVADALSQGR